MDHFEYTAAMHTYYRARERKTYNLLPDAAKLHSISMRFTHSVFYIENSMATTIKLHRNHVVIFIVFISSPASLPFARVSAQLLLPLLSRMYVYNRKIRPRCCFNLRAIPYTCSFTFRTFRSWLMKSIFYLLWNERVNYLDVSVCVLCCAVDVARSHSCKCILLSIGSGECRSALAMTLHLFLNVSL